jgi:hypothetical protein
MTLLVLQSRGWAWTSSERALLLEGNSVSAGIRAQDQLRAVMGLTLDERVELMMVATLANQLRARLPEALDGSDEMCEVARTASLDLRCLSESLRAEVVSASGLELGYLEESVSRVIRFRDTFMNDVNSQVLSTMNMVIARTAYVLGDVILAEDSLVRVKEGGNTDPWIDAWALVTHAQCQMLHGEPAAALRTAQTAAAGADMMSRAFGASSLWASIAEVAWHCGDEEQAWAWGTAALDAGAVRPADRRSTFMPGSLIWSTGL